ncbi:hypothetical protein TWF970_010803 [Orbilia oligospora]|uniref:Ribokinase n=1 Tax=Orbilia oligospora TaxID=2813651 RepID=A0A7C8VAK2_ORBOL|nr:hypothetical protein TWF970_010803 [Orbilia oligospora]
MSLCLQKLSPPNRINALVYALHNMQAPTSLCSAETNGSGDVSYANMRRRIVVLGSLNVDMIFTTDRVPGIGESTNALSFARLHGGKGANTAVAAYRLSHNRPDHSIKRIYFPSIDPSLACRTVDTADFDIRVALHGAVGGDGYGARLKEQLSEIGIDVTGVDILPADASGICCVLVDSKTGESSNIAYQGANMNWQPSEALMSSLCGSDKPDLLILHFDTSLESVRKILETTSKYGIDTLLNPSPADYLDTRIYHNLTHLILNESEAMKLSKTDIGQFAIEAAWQTAGRYFIKLGVEHVVITLGAKGAYYVTASKSGLVNPTEVINVVDTTGAGDTFAGMYAVEYVKTKRLGIWDVATAVGKACKAAAVTVERLGAQDSIPWSNFYDGQ